MQNLLGDTSGVTHAYCARAVEVGWDLNIQEHEVCSLSLLEEYLHGMKAAGLHVNRC